MSEASKAAGKAASEIFSQRWFRGAPEDLPRMAVAIDRALASERAQHEAVVKAADDFIAALEGLRNAYPSSGILDDLDEDDGGGRKAYPGKPKSAKFLRLVDELGDNYRRVRGGGA